MKLETSDFTLTIERIKYDSGNRSKYLYIQLFWNFNQHFPGIVALWDLIVNLVRITFGKNCSKSTPKLKVSNNNNFLYLCAVNLIFPSLSQGACPQVQQSIKWFEVVPKSNKNKVDLFSDLKKIICSTCSQI